VGSLGGTGYAGAKSGQGERRHLADLTIEQDSTPMEYHHRDELSQDKIIRRFIKRVLRDQTWRIEENIAKVRKLMQAIAKMKERDTARWVRKKKRLGLHEGAPRKDQGAQRVQ
jgi:hypothetical protein